MISGMSKTTNFESAIRAGRVVEGMTFNQKIWALTAQIPKGRVTTYAELARAVGTKAYRACRQCDEQEPLCAGSAVSSSGREQWLADRLRRRAG